MLIGTPGTVDALNNQHSVSRNPTKTQPDYPDAEDPKMDAWPVRRWQKQSKLVVTKGRSKKESLFFRLDPALFPGALRTPQEANEANDSDFSRSHLHNH